MVEREPSRAGEVPPVIEAILGSRVVATEELTSPWGSRTRTRLLIQEHGEPVVLQSTRDRRALARRLRLGLRLPAVAPWLPLPDVLAGDAGGPMPFLLSRFVPGASGREPLVNGRGAEILGGAMGSLARDLARVPTAGLRLPRQWATPERLALAGGRWLAESEALLGPATSRRVEVLLDRVPDELGGVASVFAHGDLAPVNVVVRDGAIVALLDFERARLAHPLFDAAWWRWIIRWHHPERWLAAGPAFFRAAGVEDGSRTNGQLNMLAVLQCMEMIHLSAAKPAGTRREWADRISAVLGWS